MCVGAWQNAETILVAFSDEFGVATLDFRAPEPAPELPSTRLKRDHDQNKHCLDWTCTRALCTRLPAEEGHQSPGSIVQLQRECG